MIADNTTEREEIPKPLAVEGALRDVCGRIVSNAEARSSLLLNLSRVLTGLATVTPCTSSCTEAWQGGTGLNRPANGRVLGGNLLASVALFSVAGVFVLTTMLLRSFPTVSTSLAQTRGSHRLGDTGIPCAPQQAELGSRSSVASRIENMVSDPMLLVPGQYGEANPIEYRSTLCNSRFSGNSRDVAQRRGTKIVVNPFLETVMYQYPECVANALPFVHNCCSPKNRHAFAIP